MGLSSHRNVLGQLETLLFVTLFNLEGTGPWERCGDIAQLGERLPCKQEVAGSIPTISTSKNQKPQPRPNRNEAQRSGFVPKKERQRSGVQFSP